MYSVTYFVCSSRWLLFTLCSHRWTCMVVVTVYLWHKCHWGPWVLLKALKVQPHQGAICDQLTDSIFVLILILNGKHVTFHSSVMFTTFYLIKTSCFQVARKFFMSLMEVEVYSIAFIEPFVLLVLYFVNVFNQDGFF